MSISREYIDNPESNNNEEDILTKYLNPISTMYQGNANYQQVANNTFS